MEHQFIELVQGQDAWYVIFDNLPGEFIPLPLTPVATLEEVRRHASACFPDATIRFPWEA